MPGPIETYKKVKTSDDVSQYKAVTLLLEGALERVRLARQAQQEGNPEVRGLAVGGAITILGVLQGSLDHSLGGEISANLDALYDYMTRQLGAAAVSREVTTFDEVERLLLQLLYAWTEIDPDTEIG